MVAQVRWLRALLKRVLPFRYLPFAGADERLICPWCGVFIEGERKEEHGVLFNEATGEKSACPYPEIEREAGA